MTNLCKDDETIKSQKSTGRHCSIVLFLYFKVFLTIWKCYAGREICLYSSKCADTGQRFAIYMRLRVDGNNFVCENACTTLVYCNHNELEKYRRWVGGQGNSNKFSGENMYQKKILRIW